MFRYAMNQEKLLDVLSFTPSRAEYPFAWAGHLPFAYYITREMAPSIIVELGTHKGNSLCAFAEGAKYSECQATIYGIDSWEGDPHANYSGGSDIYNELNSFVSRKYDNVVLLRSYFDAALEQFEADSIDLLHVDGFHSYEAVKHDFESWLPKVKSDGVILLHDIAIEREGFGAKRFWEEIQPKYQTLAFSHSHGLGVVLMEEAGRRQVIRELVNDYNGRKVMFGLLEAKGLAVLHECEKSSDEYVAKYIRKLKAVQLAANIPLKRILRAIYLKARQ